MPRRISSIPQKQPPASTATSRRPVDGFEAAGLTAPAGFAASPAGAGFPNSGRYWPYPSSSSFSTGTKRRAAEFMQKRWPVGAGPSSNTCPRCESACFERTSVRVIQKVLSVFVVTFAGSRGRVKLGQPVPDSNLSSEENSGSPDTTST